MSDRVIRALLVFNWRREPTMMRILRYSALPVIVWGLVFGVIDSALLSVGKWLYALFAGVVFAALMFGCRGLDRWAVDAYALSPEPRVTDRGRRRVDGAAARGASSRQQSAPKR